MRELAGGVGRRFLAAVHLGSLSMALVFGGELRAEWPSPALQHVSPAGGQIGTSFGVAVQGGNLDELTALRFSDPRIGVQKAEGQQFTLTIPADVPPGVYDVRAVGKFGISGPRAFFIGNRPECREAEPNDLLDQAQPALLDGMVNGRLDKPGDVDCFRFTARAGERVVLDLWAERLDSPLHGVLEVYDPAGRRVAVNRGDSRVDPLVDFRASVAGTYQVKLFDQTYLGGGDFVYRLEIETGPRVEFAVPCVVARGEPARVTLFGRNLGPSGSSAPAGRGLRDLFEGVEIELPPSQAGKIPLPLRSTQSLFEGFPYYSPGSQVPVLIGVTDVPVVRDAADNHQPAQAQKLSVPCEVSGQLTEGAERDWFAVPAAKGEVLWIEALGERIGSPVDLDVVIVDPEQRELARFSDQLSNLGGTRFPTQHTDPAGRFVVPADGTYLVLVQNLIGGSQADPRRIYRLAVRREEPDFHLTLVPRRGDQATGLNVWRGGRELAEIFAVRRRGMTEPIRISAANLPPGVECPDVWLGAGEERGTVVVTASRDAAPFVGTLNLVGRAEVGGVELTRPVRGGTLVRPGQPNGWGRLTDEISLALAPESSLLITATPGEASLFQDSILDVAVTVERRFGADGPIQLSGVGLPQGMESPVATIPAGQTQGWLSFAVPAELPAGPYTFAVQAEAEIPFNNGKLAVTTFSNPITIQIAPARIHVTIDPRTPRKIARGQVIHIRYKAERRHGFIGKVHTELAAPGGVVGIRGRGVTSTGQTEAGEIQVIATENAVPGQLVFLRLEAVGTVEDQPLYRGSRFVSLEITE
jgi:hypothetical protein